MQQITQTETGRHEVRPDLVLGSSSDENSRFAASLPAPLSGIGDETEPPRKLAQALNQRVLSERLGLVIVLSVFAIGAWLTWRKWPDLLVDFGAQLYLPWRISQGSVLYRDVMYLTGGPLSQYYHAALFKLFGVSFLTLILSNLSIAAGLLVLMYRKFLRCSDAWTAATICVGVTLALAFGQYSDIGNYNFVAPYCHEVWHGVALSIVALSLLSSWIARPRVTSALGAGFFAGLVFMTKPDVFVALMLAYAAAMILTVNRSGARAVAQLLLISLSSASVPLLAFLIYFHQFESWRASIRSVLFAWVPLLTTSVSKQVFYKWCMGLDVPGFHIARMLLQFAVLCGVIAACAVWFRRELNTSTKRLLAVAFVALLVALATGVDWVDSGRSLPLLVLALCCLLGAKYRARAKNFAVGVRPCLCATTLEPRAVDEHAGVRLRAIFAAPANGHTPCSETASRDSTIFPLLWAIFGLGLLAKLGLFPRLWHYGFILAMPAFAAAIYLLLWELPGRLEQFGVRRNLFRCTIWLLLMTAFLRLFVQSQHLLNQKTLAVGKGTDTLLTFNEKVQPAGPMVQSALDWMEKNAPPAATLAVLPEGIMVNYLSRRVNPTKYVVWNPAEIAGLGQIAMTTTFQENPPDYVMLIHRDPSEYGVKFFGQEERFGLKLMQWIETNYQPVYLIGNEPLRNSLFGIKIMKRISGDTK